MFTPRRNRTIVAEGQKVVGALTSDGTVEIYGKVEGKINCASLIVNTTAHIIGSIKADNVSVNGTIEGPIECREIVFNTQANVIGDVECEAVVIEKGAFMQGRLRRRPSETDQPDRLTLLNKALVTPADREQEMAKIAAAESVTTRAELAVEARHLSGNPDLSADEALVFLAERGNQQAKVFLDSETPAEPKQANGPH